jgi:acyl dehydratase
VDADFANNSQFRGIIAHGTLSLNLIWEAIELTFGAPTIGCHMVDIRFKAPVRENDLVEAGGERQDNGEFKVWVRNQHGDVVIEGTARINEQELLDSRSP